jgi:RecD/TraA family predicted helicase
MSEKEIVELEVRVMAEVVYKEDSNWGNYGCVPTDIADYASVVFNKYGNMTVVGVVQRLGVNGVYHLKAEVKNDPKWGVQYKIIKMWQDMPSTPEQQFAFLEAFVTPLQLDSIKRVYEGEDVIELFKTDKFDWKKVYGFGEYTYNIIKDRILKNLEMLELINEFPDISYNILKRIMTKFTSVALMAQKIRENPYILTTLGGIGFKTADKIALEMGFETTSPLRIQAAIFHCVKEVEQSGDTYIKGTKLINDTFELLGVGKKIIKEQLDSIEEIVRIDDRFSLRKTFELEVLVAEKLLDMKKNSKVINFDVDNFIIRMEDKHKIKLTGQQKQFFHNFVRENVTFLVGYAGCGKSMLQKLGIEMFEELGLSYTLLAPTGKASKVLGKYTKRPAHTIHKKTGYGKNLQGEDVADYFVYEDVIIVDESSMCGVGLAKALLYALKNPNARIIIIGDSFQIPSVDKGNFLYDCQESGVFPVTKLDIVFRQSEGGILDLVTKVRLGQKFIDDDFTGIKQFGENCILVACPQDKMEKGYMYYFNDLVKKYGSQGVLTLSPTKKGKLGTYAINRTLQNIVNPKLTEDEAEIKQTKDFEEMLFRVDDMVINTVNSYKMKARGHSEDDETYDIMNGDTGTIVDIDVKERIIYVEYDDAVIVTASSDIEKLLHAYCLTMHKSQGSSCKSVISITDRAHTFQLNANLIYTAWSRPEEFLVVLCQPSVVNQAIKKIENLRRNTFLCELLKREIDLKELEMGLEHYEEN